MSTFEIVCEHCKSRYQLPAALREALRGSIATCVVCMREWVPVPGGDGGLGGGFGNRPTQPPIALHHYLQSNPYSYLSDASSAPGTATAEVPAARSPRLRIVAQGPDLSLDSVFELGSRALLIGRRGCHLDLAHAEGLPERAIRVRTAEGGFELEGIGGFLIPLGPVSVAVGRIDPGARLDVAIGPYRLALEPTSAPGKPIPDLERGGSAAGAAAARPAAPEPASDMSQTVRGLGSMGFDTRRFSDPLEHLEVGLLGLDAPIEGETFRIKKTPALIGRTTGDILIPDARVSGKHAQIDILAVDQYAIKDLASTNGTSVNDRPASTTRLKDGDVIGLGGVRLQFIARPKKRA